MRSVLCTATVAAALLSPPFAAAQAHDGSTENEPAVEKKERRVLPKNTLTFNSGNLLILGLYSKELIQGVSETLMTNNLGVYSLEYERALTDHVSAYAAPAYISYVRNYGGVPFTGFGADVGVRYFFEGEAPSGLWAAANLNAKTLSGTAPTTMGTMGKELSLFGGGVMVGYTFLAHDVFDISLGAGGGANYVADTSLLRGSVLSQSEEVDPVLLLRLNVGFAF